MPNLPSPLIEPTLRDDLPCYPPLIQLIRVTAATVPGPAGVAQTAGSSVLGPTLYVAFTQQLRTDSLLPRDREPCLADDVNGLGINPGYYGGRLAGSHSSLPVYEIISPSLPSPSATPDFAFVKDLDETPTSGRYGGVIQVEQADGTLIDAGNTVWLREGNNKDRLIVGEKYYCKRTGFTAGRHVYTCVDFNLTVRNEDGGISYSQIFRVRLGPDNNWNISQPEERSVLLKRILDVYEGAALKMQYVKEFIFDDTDFDVTPGAAGSGSVMINTSGYTGDFYVLTNCVAGVLKKRLLSFIRGLLKTVGAEIDL